MRLDLGCGLKNKEGHVGVDSLSLPGVDVVADLRVALGLGRTGAWTAFFPRISLSISLQQSESRSSMKFGAS